MFYAFLPNPQHTPYCLPTQRPWHQEDNSSRRASKLSARPAQTGGISLASQRQDQALFASSPSHSASSPASNHGPSYRAPTTAPAAANSAGAAGGQGGDAPHPGIVPDQVQVSGQDLGEEEGRGRRRRAGRKLTEPSAQVASLLVIRLNCVHEVPLINRFTRACLLACSSCHAESSSPSLPRLLLGPLGSSPAPFSNAWSETSTKKNLYVQLKCRKGWCGRCLEIDLCCVSAGGGGGEICSVTCH